MLETKQFIVKKIDGDYAVLIRTDKSDDDEFLIARALLPLETDEGTKLLWEKLEYTII